MKINSQPVFIGENIIKDLPKFLKEKSLADDYALITDDKTAKLFGQKVLNLLKKSGLNIKLFSFSSGEKSKSIETVTALASQMLAANFDRRDCVIALGGGVVGDLAGFLASIYMRGIPVIQIPTTLLAMVDASVGGKTGVDLANGKNLLGTFHQPKAVFIDTNFLKTLPEKQIRNGLAEIIKCGVIKDKKLFEYIEKNLQKILKLEQKTLIKIIAQSLRVKKEVVEKDEKEKGIRMILNYGHTYGHALEKTSNYTLLHGFAISIGMVLANKMAVEKHLMSEKDAERIKKLLINAGLPVATMHKPTLSDLKNDKKRIGNQISFILPKKIGEVIIYKHTFKK